jgi:hypothetical protein
MEFISRPVAAKDRIRSHISPRGIFMDKVAVRQIFLLAFQFPAVSIISPLLDTNTYITDVLQSQQRREPLNTLTNSSNDVQHTENKFKVNIRGAALEISGQESETGLFIYLYIYIIRSPSYQHV